MRRFILTILALILSLTTALAGIKVQRQLITTVDGLANNSVRYMLQDSKGFLWMCTLNGLSRYDGHSFINFMPSHDGDISLANYRPNLMYEDQNGFLWITCFGDRISCYDLHHDRFVDFTGCGNYNDKYSSVTLTKNGDVWLWGKSNGALRVTWDGTRFSSEVFSAESIIKTNNVNFVSDNNDGKQVWIGTDRGLYLWQNGSVELLDAKHDFTRIHVFDSKVGVITSTGKVFCYDNQGRMQQLGQMQNVLTKDDMTGELCFGENNWLIFTRKEAYVADINVGTLSPSPKEWNIPNGFVIIDNRGDYWIHNHTGRLRYFSKNGHLLKDFILMPPAQAKLISTEKFFVVQDSRDLIWIATYGRGVFTYNKVTDEITQYLAESSNPIISGNTIQYLMEDRSGSIWISSEFCGINHLKVINDGATRLFTSNDDSDKINANDIRLITEDKNGDVIVSSRDGLVCIYDSKLNALKSQYVVDKNLYASYYDSQGRHWRGTRGDGLYVDDIQYKYDTSDSTSIGGNDIFCLLKDRSDRMWIGTFGGGLNLAITNADGSISFRHFFNNEYGEKRVQCLTEDSEGNIWAGTGDGVFVFHPDSLFLNPTAYQHYNMTNTTLHSDEIRAIICDRAGNIWIAETGAGFAKYELRNQKESSNSKEIFKHYGVKDGLVNSMVQAFVDVSPKQLWITTEYGVSCFNPMTENFENYFFADDMTGNTYSQGSAFLLADGRLAFGSKRGVTIVDTSKTKHAAATKAVTFTSLFVNGVPTASANNTDIDIDNAISYASKVSLPYDQNSIRIDFSTFEYSSLSPQNYSHYLEGYDKKWSVPSAETFVTYKNLPSGKYKLHVKSAENDGASIQSESIIEIRVTPPWWRSIWAYIIYTLLAIVIIAVVFVHLKHIEQLHNRIKLEQQLTDFKLKFFTNVSHEFRTPLTLINGALERMRRNESLPADTQVSLQVMEKSSQRMMRLINQILEFRKVQKGKASLSLLEVDVIAFIREIYESFIDSAIAKKIDLQIRTSHDSFVTYIDKDKMDKVIYNLLSNALKYTLSGGSITMTVDVLVASKELAVKVIDTGIGIPKEKRDHIFERFAHGNLGLDSMGIGLNLTYELVKIHHGNITYAENPVGGSIFSVVVPIDKNIYSINDFVHTASTEQEKQQDPHELGKVVEVVRETVAPLNNRKVLVIEDDNDVREFLRIELSTYFEVETAADGIAGYDYAANNSVDLIVCDVLMPGMTGFEVTKKLKENFETSHIPIILATALSANDKQIEGFKSGADAYITKPFSTEVLINRIFQLIEQRDRLREKFSTDLSLLTPITVTNDKDKEFVDKLNKILEENLDNDSLSAEDIVNMMALSRSIFFSKVKGLTGYGPKEYLRMLRLKKAAELLRHQDLNISDVAYSVGFTDPLYFSKCFRAQFKQSPTEYRKTLGII